MALSPMFSPTHVAYTGEQVEVICESKLMLPNDGDYDESMAVTFRSAAMDIWITTRNHFDSMVPDPQDQTREVRRYAPIVGA